jgi:hypothetical protein
MYPYFVIVGILSLAFPRIILYSLSDKELIIFTGIYGFQQQISFPINQISDIRITSRERLYYAEGVLRYSIPQKILLIRLKDKLPIEQHKKIIKLGRSFLTSVFRIHTVDANNEGDEIYLTRKPKGGYESILYAIKQKINPDEASPRKSSMYKKVAVGIYDMILISSISFVSYYIYIGKFRQIDFFVHFLRAHWEIFLDMYFR